MSAIPYILTCSVASAAGINLLGCAPRRGESSAAQSAGMTGALGRNPAPAPDSGWREQAVGLPQPQTPVAQGPAPLVYLLDIGGPIRVVDVDTGTTIAQTNAPDHSIIVVDDRRGVVVGSATVLSGPLPASHHYAILVKPTTPGVMRQTGPSRGR